MWSAGELKAFCEWQGWRDGFPLWFCLWQLHYMIQERARRHVNPPSIKDKSSSKSQEFFLFSFLGGGFSLLHIVCFVEITIWPVGQISRATHVREFCTVQTHSRQVKNSMFYFWLTNAIHQRCRSCGACAETVVCQQGINSSYYCRLWRDTLSVSGSEVRYVCLIVQYAAGADCKIN